MNNTQLNINNGDVLDAKEISNILGLGYTKTLSLIKYGGLSYIKIGNTYRVTKKAFEEWLFTEGQRKIKLEN